MRALKTSEMEIATGGGSRANDALLGAAGTALGGGSCGLQGAAAGALAGAAMGPLFGNFIGQAVSGACSNGYTRVPLSGGGLLKADLAGLRVTGHQVVVQAVVVVVVWELLVAVFIKAMQLLAWNNHYIECLRALFFNPSHCLYVCSFPPKKMPFYLPVGK